MSVKFTTAALLLLGAASLNAQTSAPSYIITRLGVDTVAIERFTRASDKVEGDLVLRYPRVRTFHYVGALGPKGEFKSLNTTVRRANDAPGGPPAMEIGSTFADSLAVFNVSRNGKPDTSMNGARIVYHGGVAPTI